MEIKTNNELFVRKQILLTKFQRPFFIKLNLFIHCRLYQIFEIGSKGQVFNVVTECLSRMYILVITLYIVEIYLYSPGPGTHYNYSNF